MSEKTYPKRTLQQNKALHVLFGLLAQTLNEAGMDMKRTLKEGVDIPWSPQTVKEWLWKPLQKAQLQKESTTELSTKDIDLVFETLVRYLGEKHGVELPPFPSVEEIINRKEDG